MEVWLAFSIIKSASNVSSIYIAIHGVFRDSCGVKFSNFQYVQQTRANLYILRQKAVSLYQVVKC